MLGAIVGGVGSLVSGFAGASASRSAATAARRNANQERIALFNQQTAAWDVEQANQQLAYDHAVATARLQANIERAIAMEQWNLNNALSQASFLTERTNAEMQVAMTNAQNDRDFQMQRLAQAADYRAQMRVYEASEETFAANTRLIAQAASQGYNYQKEKFDLTKAQLMIDRDKIRAEGRQTRGASDAKLTEIRDKLRGELRQRGLKGRELQLELRQQMQQYTGEVDKSRREAAAGSADVAAAGRQGNSAIRAMREQEGLQALQLGSMGVELAWTGRKAQLEMVRLAQETNLMTHMAKLDQADTVRQANNTIEMLNFALKESRLQEDVSIFDYNNSIQDTSLQAQSQMNEAESNRELRPLDPLNIPAPLQASMPFFGQPIQSSRPIAASRAATRPIIPSMPIAAPRPTLAAPTFNPTSGAGLQLLSGITSATSGIASAWMSRPQAFNTNTPTTIN